ncbi:MAG: 50S ribosomal protein L10 [Candidatus Micrarchaeia archaeon]|jgi:large subunit ribosomal protein L10
MLSKQQKKDAVAALKKDLSAYPVIGLASLQNLPGRQFMTIKNKISGDVKLVVTRSTLIMRAIEEGKPEAKELEQYAKGTTAVVFSKIPPFKLAKIFRQNKSKAAAKPGMVAEYDIVIPAGETNLAPGPVLTELKQAKIDARIQGTKVVIGKDCTIVKKGEAVSDTAAKILSKLGVEPFEVGLRASALWENGTLYKPEVLDVDDSQYVEMIKQAAAQALNLAVFAEIYNEQSAPAIIAKAAREANAIKALVDSKQPAAAPAATEAAPAEPAAPTA